MTTKILSEYVQEVLGKSVVFGGDTFMYFQQLLSKDKIVVDSLFVTKESRNVTTFSKILKVIMDKERGKSIIVPCKATNRDLQIALLKNDFLVDGCQDGVCYYMYSPTETLEDIEEKVEVTEKPKDDFWADDEDIEEKDLEV